MKFLCLQISCFVFFNYNIMVNPYIYYFYENKLLDIGISVLEWILFEHCLISI